MQALLQMEADAAVPDPGQGEAKEFPKKSTKNEADKKQAALEKDCCQRRIRQRRRLLEQRVRHTADGKYAERNGASGATTLLTQVFQTHFECGGFRVG